MVKMKTQPHCTDGQVEVQRGAGQQSWAVTEPKSMLLTLAALSLEPIRKQGIGESWNPSFGMKRVAGGLGAAAGLRHTWGWK